MADHEITSVEEYRDLLKASSSLERAFEFQLSTRRDEIPKPASHYKFHPERKWEFDAAWPDYMLAVELDGGAHGRKIVCHNCGVEVRAVKKDGTPGKVVHTAGWHSRPARFTSDIKKMNEAQRLGWIVLRFTNEDVIGDPFSMLNYLQSVLDSRQRRMPMIEGLTARETSIIHAIAGGFVTSEIADRLDIAKATVRGHAQKISQKLNVKTRAAAVARAAAWGFLNFDSIPWADDISSLYDAED